MSEFNTWLNECDAWLRSRLQFGIAHIADWNWRYAFEDGMSPEDAARQAFADDDLGALFIDLLDGEAGQTF